MEEMLWVCEIQFSNLLMQYIFEIVLSWKIRFTHMYISEAKIYHDRIKEQEEQN